MINTKNYFAFVLIILALLLVTNKSNAQINGIPGTVNAGQETSPLNQVISIGDVPLNGPLGLNLVRAKLHVNSFFIPASSAINPVGAGDVFRTTGINNVVNSWRLFTGATNPGTEKGMIFNFGNNPVAADQTNFSIQASVRDMTFHTLPIVTNTVGTERMRIVGVARAMPWPIGTTVRAGNVGIGNTDPLCMQQIGGNSSAGAGWRPWMDIGTLYASRQGYDNMYVGLDSTNSDQWDAIINWGNNPSQNNDGDRLRYVFTAAPGNGTASGVPGLEISRMWSNGNTGRTGFGGDVNSPNLYSTGSPDPQNTVEINSPANSNIPGQSGLRFTDLTSASTPNPSNNLALSVDINGDVILVPGGGNINNANNGTSISGGNTVVLGNVMGGNAAQLLNDREIPMNDWNLVFTPPSTPNSLKNRVGFGISNPGAEVEIFSVNGAYVGNTLPIVRNGGNAAAGWQCIGGGLGAKKWIVHTTGQGNYQGVGKFIFHVDSTNIVTMLPPTSPHMTDPDGKVGILTDYPNNSLEINAPGLTTAIGGSSGLRFTNLTTASPTTPNTGLGVLSVDANGDVVYVPASTGIGTGLGTCLTSPTTFPFGDHGAIDLGANNNNFYFLGNGVANKTNIGVGYPCSYNVPAKLSVYQTGYTTNQFNALKTVQAGDFWASSNLTGSPLSIGVRGVANSPNGLNIGVWGYVSGTSTLNSPPSSDLAGLFQGDVWVSGITSGTGFISPSDSRLKKDTVPFSQGIDIIRNIHPFTFRYNGLAGFESDKFHTGVFADQLVQIAPYAIDTLWARLDSTDIQPSALLSIKNDAILYTSINAIKQLDSITTDLSLHSVTQASNGCNIINGNNIEFGTNALKHDTKLPLNEYSLSFEDPQNSVQGKNLFRIGDINNNTKAKFTVDNNTRLAKTGRVVHFDNDNKLQKR